MKKLSLNTNSEKINWLKQKLSGRWFYEMDDDDFEFNLTSVFGFCGVVFKRKEDVAKYHKQYIAGRNRDLAIFQNKSANLYIIMTTSGRYFAAAERLGFTMIMTQKEIRDIIGE